VCSSALIRENYRQKSGWKKSDSQFRCLVLILIMFYCLTGPGVGSGAESIKGEAISNVSFTGDVAIALPLFTKGLQNLFNSNVAIITRVGKSDLIGIFNIIHFKHSTI
jgi:hypothetical protein